MTTNQRLKISNIKMSLILHLKQYLHTFAHNVNVTVKIRYFLCSIAAEQGKNSSNFNLKKLHEIYQNTILMIGNEIFITKNLFRHPLKHKRPQ